MTTVEMKHFDPHFDKDRWRTLVEERRVRALSLRETLPILSPSLTDLCPSLSALRTLAFFTRALARRCRRVSQRGSSTVSRTNARQLTLSLRTPVMFYSRSSRMGFRLIRLKVTKFPGAVGVDIAKQIDRAIQQLQGCDRLIIDLRGNAGGGLAFLRVMSYLTPERVPVGYSVTRARAETNYSKDSLATFDRIPSQKAALILLALKFGFRDDSVSIVTEEASVKSPSTDELFFSWTTVQPEPESGSPLFACRNESWRQLSGPRPAGTADLLQRLQDHPRLLRPGFRARAWYTWRGELLEGQGRPAPIAVYLQNGQASCGDIQLQQAIATVSGIIGAPRLVHGWNRSSFSHDGSGSPGTINLLHRQNLLRHV